MLTRKLGRTGLNVSLIGLGTMTYGEQNTEAEGHVQMDAALARGINFFDTAELYSIPPRPETKGSTERIIGTWLASRKCRDKVIIATKAVGRTAMPWFRNGGSPARVTLAQLTEAIDGSLQRLQTDYIDLYQLHWPDRPTPFGANPTRYRHAEFSGDPGKVGERGVVEGADEPFEAQLDALDRFVRAGKIRHVGVSNESAWGMMRFLAEANARGLPRMQSIQNAYNLLNRTFDTALAEIAMREDVSLIAYSPLGQGYLTGKYLDGARPAGARNTLFNRGQRYEMPGSEAAIRAYIAVAREAGLDPSHMAIAFVAQQPFVASVLIGATSMAQLEHGMAALDQPLSADVNAAIDAVHQRHGNPAP
ncbi:MAG: aldo/keto reductase [Hyphomicrobiaceae bacterium]|nr:aldo/keto reductase [Hyphomicrobiaceae bacterium]